MSYFINSFSSSSIESQKNTPKFNLVDFENMKANLKSLSPSQLRSLKSSIEAELTSKSSSSITDEELSMISSLFR
ncbi:hypothetical protein VIBC2010_04904 [Vibrio caribbeanicus ATCC BAA-2122]|uniref:Uncharacterized protein n=1 Tax=Vibrio caribbeanicus ATCC BAA-2122 TaxID=796620 RepID=E3BKA4_9VIBR|nr:hypothetical protein VIBC2010_04904 [Vibrio caribbeanicus ATCC BAA-2122]